MDKLNHYLDKFSVKLHGFVIMPDHVHLLITMGEIGNVSQFVGRIKERTAKDILKWCEENKQNVFLKTFQMSAIRYKNGSKNQVWQERFDALEIVTHDTFNTKLNYIHNNPLQEKWRLCDNVEDYKFSSAKYYINNEYTGVTITVMD
jgi:putative transposase